MRIADAALCSLPKGQGAWSSRLPEGKQGLPIIRRDCMGEEGGVPDMKLLILLLPLALAGCGVIRDLPKYW